MHTYSQEETKNTGPGRLKIHVAGTLNCSHPQEFLSWVCVDIEYAFCYVRKQSGLVPLENFPVPHKFRRTARCEVSTSGFLQTCLAPGLPIQAGRFDSLDFFRPNVRKAPDIFSIPSQCTYVLTVLEITLERLTCICQMICM